MIKSENERKMQEKCKSERRGELSKEELRLISDDASQILYPERIN